MFSTHSGVKQVAQEFRVAAWVPKNGAIAPLVDVVATSLTEARRTAVG